MIRRRECDGLCLINKSRKILRGGEEEEEEEEKEAEKNETEKIPMILNKNQLKKWERWNGLEELFPSPTG